MDQWYFAHCRAQGRFQLGEGWKPFAQHWDLGHGEQIQLSRRFVSSGCIWLDVQFVQEEPAPQAPGIPSAVVSYACLSFEVQAVSECLVLFLWLCSFSPDDLIGVM